MVIRREETGHSQGHALDFRKAECKQFRQRAGEAPSTRKLGANGAKQSTKTQSYGSGLENPKLILI